ncbi:hypothetical protein SAMN05878426_11011 [Phaeovulum vinaykumarii]|uniref:Uncharacterized protein n=2 Tax=Phaeovulum vinaykumarii TaxID=407234 RepID=A0A1N7MY44_9RHOB|nr:hypothetical protein SAMN05421795_11152 [Phaeovulum vinaykumarii]SOC15927.1 hypothetical protein SAMN05878426_11011 [Phaeovulum vinaykumarii]
MEGVDDMKHMVRTAVAAAAISVSSLVGSIAPAQAYQVDCAILLCLAGGWPASAPCAHARSVFIQRITPWPIEPPLQIWRCPMGASFNAPAFLSPQEQLRNASFRKRPHLSVLKPALPLVQVRADEKADIDISGQAFDFVRSIRVFHVQFSQHQNHDGDCITSDATRLGSYGIQGDYHWTRSSAAQVPPASELPNIDYCNRINYRSVFVDWRDHEGNYGFEEVRY